ncbi:MAG: hypothetical protein MK111_24725 [Crocosphaera sp.]|uniref:Programmed cell death antitoxin YdcD n=3 Tax=Crocosphaera watsonii TaxID=263511 RepID=T2JIN4_CROWT|nr:MULTISPECIES: hypothetical protein [Crocosphaera]EHJ11593.1 hypothetical protein CWATWH0003_3677 [Crocosphaera watsonii WH 0003]MCH2247793.1 hypothetical protein [Crocosphaera sp.]CCQ55313.1 hypothetical protein CWATWH0005_5273 [Crocosphaera watsonii WH 0005]CCQ65693.1 hypothetical protein CWATWH0402_4525 [Crocosphaera watsonii WH 0402]
MPSKQVIDIERKLHNCSVEDKQWLLQKVTEQLQVSHSNKAKELMNSWDEAYSDGLDDSETSMLEAMRCHQGQLSE